MSASDLRYDRINEDLQISQYRSGLTFGTDAYLLSAFIRRNARHRGAELGAGTGVISFLLLRQNKIRDAALIELQESYCDLCRKNAAGNALDHRVRVFHRDVCDIAAKDLGAEMDLVFTNPPYMKADCGKKNESEEKYLARHESSGDIGAFALAAARLLKDGGRFYCVYRPDRTADLFHAMKNAGIEPKRAVFVYPTVDHKPCLLLAEGKKGAESGMTVTKPLIIYKDKPGGAYTEEFSYIYETGSFHEQYQKL